MAMKNLSKYGCLGLLIILWLTSCQIVPRTTEELRKNAYDVHEFVVNEGIEDAFRLVAEKSVQCHQGDSWFVSPAGAGFVSTSTSIRINGELQEGGESGYVEVRLSNISVRGLLQLIDLSSLNEQSTEIHVYMINNSKKWTQAAYAVEKWFDGASGCP